MFDPAPPNASPPEVIARFDELFERCYPTRTTESSALLDRIGASWRAQNRAAAAALAAIGELFAYRLSRCSDTEDWAVDTEAAVSAEVAAALADEPRPSGEPIALCPRDARAAAEAGRRLRSRRYRPADIRHDRLSHRSDHRPRCARGRRRAAGRHGGALAIDDSGAG